MVVLAFSSTVLVSTEAFEPDERFFMWAGDRGHREPARVHLLDPSGPTDLHAIFEEDEAVRLLVVQRDDVLPAWISGEERPEVEG